MEKLPYAFDLFFDIKSINELYKILNEDSLDVCFNQFELEELMDKYKLPYPKKYQRRTKPGFPKEIWIDKNGGYLTYPPCESEKDKYQKMRRF